jgi:hypothetical protein
MAPDGPTSIQTMLEEYFIDDVNVLTEKWCMAPLGPDDQKKITVTKRINRPPQFLILHVARFAFDPTTLTISKNKRRATLPLALTLPGGLPFALETATCHEGDTPWSGHYYTWRRRPQTGTFVLHNDDHVSECPSLPSTVEENCYVLQYRAGDLPLPEPGSSPPSFLEDDGPSVDAVRGPKRQKAEGGDSINEVYNKVIRPEFAKSPILHLSELRSVAEEKGFTEQQFQNSVDFWEDLAVFHYVDGGSAIQMS